MIIENALRRLPGDALDDEPYAGWEFRFGIHGC
jgi:hypothetical protein